VKVLPALGSYEYKSRRWAVLTSKECLATLAHAGRDEFTMAMTDSRLRRLRVVILKIPFDEVLNTLVEFGARSIAHIARQGVDVRRRIRNVARLQGHEILDRLAPETVFEHLDEAQQRDGTLIADVVILYGARLPLGSGASEFQCGSAPATWSTAATTPFTMSST